MFSEFVYRKNELLSDGKIMNVPMIEFPSAIFALLLKRELNYAGILFFLYYGILFLSWIFDFFS